MWQRISRNLQIKLSSKFEFSKNSYEELVKAIKIRIERKHPSKNRILKFISSTKQGPDQSLSEYIHSAHRVAAESGLHDGEWTTHDIETLIIISGMKNPGQNYELLFEHKTFKKSPTRTSSLIQIQENP